MIVLTTVGSVACTVLDPTDHTAIFKPAAWQIVKSASQWHTISAQVTVDSEIATPEKGKHAGAQAGLN